MDSITPDDTRPLLDFLRSHVVTSAWFKQRTASAGTIHSIVIDGIETDAHTSCRTVNYRCELLDHHISWARMTTVSARLRLMHDGVSVAHEQIVAEAVEDQNVDVPESADLIETVEE